MGWTVWDTRADGAAHSDTGIERGLIRPSPVLCLSLVARQAQLAQI